MSQGIFISYRRDDTRLIASWLYEALKAAFPKKKIFFDVDIPEPGNEIIAKIVRELQSSQVVIALIGPQWNAKNCLDSTHDFVRRELKSALDLRQEEGARGSACAGEWRQDLLRSDCRTISLPSASWNISGSPARPTSTRSSKARAGCCRPIGWAATTTSCVGVGIGWIS